MRTNRKTVLQGAKLGNHEGKNKDKEGNLKTPVNKKNSASKKMLNIVRKYSDDAKHKLEAKIQHYHAKEQ